MRGDGVGVGDIGEVPGHARAPVRCPLGNRLVPTLVPRQLLGGARVGRCHGLREELALAFAMGTHKWLGAGSTAGRARRKREKKRKKKHERASERERIGTFTCPQQKYQIPFERFRRLGRRLMSRRPAQSCPARTPCWKKSGRNRPSKCRQIRLCQTF